MKVYVRLKDVQHYRCLFLTAARDTYLLKHSSGHKFTVSALSRSPSSHTHLSTVFSVVSVEVSVLISILSVISPPPHHTPTLKMLTRAGGEYWCGPQKHHTHIYIHTVMLINFKTHHLLRLSSENRQPSPQITQNIFPEYPPASYTCCAWFPSSRVFITFHR